MKAARAGHKDTVDYLIRKGIVMKYIYVVANFFYTHRPV